MKKLLLLTILIIHTCKLWSQPFSYQDYCLVWSDEFDYTGAPDSRWWGYEQGCSVRNNEAQNYTSRRENSRVENGHLVIEARRENLNGCSYTSASLRTMSKVVRRFGRFEMRAKIPATRGAWPAFWTLGESGEWPSNGEIDIMEFYNNRIHANAAWGTETRWSGNWDSQNKLISDFGPGWADQFHVWRMEWTDKVINLYVDDYLMNSIDVTRTTNGSISNIRNPFLQPHYIIVNLAIGGNNGGDPSGTTFPLRYEIDYVRVYQKGDCNLDCNWQENGSAYEDDCLRCAGGNTGIAPCSLNCQDNLLTNPGFESGLTGWTGWGTRSAGTNAFSGSSGVQVGDGALERVVNVEPHMPYILRARARKSGGGWYRLGVKESGAAESYTQQTNTTWSEVSHFFTTGNANSARIYFYNGSGGTAYGDDFELEPAGCAAITSLSSTSFSTGGETVLFPNPSVSTFEVKNVNTGLLEIFSSDGTCILKERLNRGREYGASIPSGTYIIRVTSEKGISHYKWLKLSY